MDNNNELDDQRMSEAERTLSKKSESILLHKGCITKVVQQCNLENLMTQERSDFSPMEVDAESQNKSPTQAKSERQFQNFEDHEKGDTSEAAREVTLKMLDTMHTVTMIKDVDSDRAQKSESMSTVEDRLVDGQRASLLTNQNKANLEDHHPNDSVFPMRVVPSDHTSLGPLQGPGSASCRSSSSTTSARSFAFPVFSGEWIGSPVKMAGSGRGHMKRHRWWKKCFGSCSY